MLEYNEICDLSEEDKNKYFTESYVKMRKKNEQDFKYVYVAKVSGRIWTFSINQRYINIAEKDMEISLDFPESGYYDYSALDSVLISYFPNRQFKKGITKRWVTFRPIITDVLGNCSVNSSIRSQLPKPPKEWEIITGLVPQDNNSHIADKIDMISSAKRFSSSLNRDFAVSPHFLGSGSSLCLWYRGRECGSIIPTKELVIKPKKNTLFYQEILDTFLPANIQVEKLQHD